MSKPTGNVCIPNETNTDNQAASDAGSAPLITKPEPHPNPQVATLQEEIYKLECELGPEIAFSADAMVARHIKLLHTYNEIKDGTQALIAKYAVMTHATVTAVHRELGLSLVE